MQSVTIDGSGNCNTSIYIRNVNQDGETKEHTYRSITEFASDWMSDDYKGPGGDDEVLAYSFGGIAQDVRGIPKNKYGYRDFGSLVDIMQDRFACKLYA